MASLRIDFATDTGPRKNNEDFFGFAFREDAPGGSFNSHFWNTKNGLSVEPLWTGRFGLNEVNQTAGPPIDLGLLWCFMIADGLGGHESGEMASEWACRGFQSSFIDSFLTSGKVVPSIEAGYRGAEDFVRSKAPPGAGTTLLCAIVYRGDLTLANIGDSRGYVMHDGRMKVHTRDHSLVQGLLESGAIKEAESLHHPQRNIITKAIGQGTWSPDVIEVGREWDDVLLCTDGVWGQFMEAGVVRLVRSQITCQELIATALERGGEDNATAIIFSNR